MRRRDFLAFLSGSAAARPFRAQASAGQHRIAIIGAAVPVASITETGDPVWRAFFAELRLLGDIEGKNLVVEQYSAEGHPERYAELAQQAVKSHPDLIYASGNGIALAVEALSRTIPIVGLLWDPLRNGLVRSLARPGGNLTGVSIDPGAAIYQKRLQLLKEAAPSASRVAVLVMRESWKGPTVPDFRAAGQRLGIALIAEPVAEGTSSAIIRTFAAILRDRPDAVFVSGDYEFFVHRRLLLDFLEKNRLPASFQWREFVAEGGLMSYGVDLRDLSRRLAGIAHRVLLGAKPADIPISQPTRFVLSINLRTAKALGLTIPQSLLALADEIIQ